MVYVGFMSSHRDTINRIVSNTMAFNSLTINSDLTVELRLKHQNLYLESDIAVMTMKEMSTAMYIT